MAKLHKAVKKGNLRWVDELIKWGADVNERDWLWGFTPLHIAARDGHREIAQLLISGGADVNAEDDDSKCPLDLASGNGHVQVTQLLIDRGADASASGALHSAAVGRHYEIVDLLRQHVEAAGASGGGEADPVLLEIFQLHLNVAVAFSDIQKVRWLLDEGVDVNFRDQWDDYGFTLFGPTPLRVAAETGHVEMARLLIERGAHLEDRDPRDEPNRGMTPLHCAASQGHAEMVRCLISSGADVDSRDEGREHHSDLLEITEFLITRWTPLHHAAVAGRADSVRVLVELGADVNARDRDGRTPLDRCAENAGFFSMGGEVRKVLKQHGGVWGARLSKDNG